MVHSDLASQLASMTKPFGSQFDSLKQLTNQFGGQLANSLDIKSVLGLSALYTHKQDLRSIYEHLGFSQFDIMLKELKLRQPFAVNLMDSIVPKVQQLQNDHLNFLHGINGILGSMGQFTQVSQHIKSIMSMEHAFLGLSHQLTKQAGLDLQLLKRFDAFSELSTDVSAIKQRAAEQQHVTKADLEELKDVLQESLNRIETNTKDKNIVLTIIMIVAFILDLIANIDNVKNIIERNQPQPGSEIVTKNDLENFKREVFDTLSTLRQESKSEIRYTRVSVNLRVKPRVNTHVVTVLRAGQELILLDTKGKWAQVSAKDRNDDVVYGWIVKKYLTKVQPD